jgi:hypothetical protein
MLGLMTIGALDVINIVCPSGSRLHDELGADVAAGAAAIVDDEGLPSSSCRPFAIGRAAVSDGPPGGHGTITVTDFDGQPCAEATEATAESKKAEVNVPTWRTIPLSVASSRVRIEHMCLGKRVNALRRVTRPMRAGTRAGRRMRMTLPHNSVPSAG